MESLFKLFAQSKAFPNCLLDGIPNWLPGGRPFQIVRWKAFPNCLPDRGLSKLFAHRYKLKNKHSQSMLNLLMKNAPLFCAINYNDWLLVNGLALLLLFQRHIICFQYLHKICLFIIRYVFFVKFVWFECLYMLIGRIVRQDH